MAILACFKQIKELKLNLTPEVASFKSFLKFILLNVDLLVLYNVSTQISMTSSNDTLVKEFLGQTTQ